MNVTSSLPSLSLPLTTLLQSHVHLLHQPVLPVVPLVLLSPLIQQLLLLQSHPPSLLLLGLPLLLPSSDVLLWSEIEHIGVPVLRRDYCIVFSLHQYQRKLIYLVDDSLVVRSSLLSLGLFYLMLFYFCGRRPLWLLLLSLFLYCPLLFLLFLFVGAAAAG